MGKPAAAPPPKFDTFWEELPCELTPTEKLLKGEQLAEHLQTVEKLELEKKTFMDDLKVRMGHAEEFISELGKQVRNGREYRQVECYEAPDYKESRVDIVRRDTGEIVRFRQMRPEERQERMPFVDTQAECTPRKQLSADNDNDGDDDDFSKGLQ